MGIYSLRKYVIQWKFSVLYCVCFQSPILIIQLWMRLFMRAFKKILFFFPYSLWYKQQRDILEIGRMAQWNRNVFNRKRHHKNACWQQNRQGTVKLLCFYIRPDYYYPVFIIKNWSLLPQFEPGDKMNILLTLVVYTLYCKLWSLFFFFFFFFFHSDLDLASFLRLLCLINTPIFQYS